MPTGGNAGPELSVVIADDDILLRREIRVYAALLAAGLDYLAAAAIAFLVAAGSNYVWNRTWTFRTPHAPVIGQGLRALVVSALSLGANQLFLLALVSAGAGHLAGQAVAIVLAGPSASWRTSLGRSGTGGTYRNSRSSRSPRVHATGGPAGFRVAPRLP